MIKALLCLIRGHRLVAINRWNDVDIFQCTRCFQCGWERRGIPKEQPKTVNWRAVDWRAVGFVAFMLGASVYAAWKLIDALERFGLV